MPRHRDHRVIAAGRRAVLEAIAGGGAREVRIARGAGLRDVLEAARRAGVPVHRVQVEVLDRMANDHRGVVAMLRAERPGKEMGERDLSSFPFGEGAVAVVLDGIVDPQNLGSAARSCEAAGVSLIVMRLRRAAPPTTAAVTASAGALLHVPLARVANIPRAIARLQQLGFTAAGLDGGAPRSIYQEPCPTGRIALVVGSEDKGISRLARERCDVLVALPMLGRVRSLNASASLAAALYG